MLPRFIKLLLLLENSQDIRYISLVFRRSLPTNAKPKPSLLFVILILHITKKKPLLSKAYDHTGNQTIRLFLTCNFWMKIFK